MQSHVTRLFTPAEAAVLTGLPLKAVHNAIDKRLVAAVADKQDKRAGQGVGQAARLLDRHGLMSLALERRLADRLAPELRRAVFEALAGAQGTTVTVEGGLLSIDLREPRRALAAALRALRQARTLVVVDPETMGGDPVFRGTRIPVHMVATLLERGMGEADLLESHPRLTSDMVRLAPTYAAAYPLRGRPKTQPWRDRPPVRTSRRKLAAVMAG